MLLLKDKLRAIIHQLNMETLLNVDAPSVIDLRSRILKLPSPELVNKMSRNELESLQKKLEYIVFDLDQASNIRSKQKALRNIADKGIPPYRKPLLATKYISNDCLDKYCSYCKSKNVKKSYKNWYSFYENN